MTRQEMCEYSVWLEDKPARVTGSKNDFATVRSLDGKHQGEWSWHSVELILTTKMGRFYL